MQYWEDFLTKFGFQDGGTTPPGVEYYRDVYIQAINAIAERRRSWFRVQAYNRDGIHNSWMVSFKNIITDIEEKMIVYDIRDTDDHFRDAVEEAKEQYLDEYVIVDTHLDTEGLDNLLQELKDNAPEEA